MSSLLKKVIKMSFFIFINKPIGLIRDILKVRFLGVGLEADAFSMAWRIPNTLRKIFGEGAITSALVPTLISVEKKHGKDFADYVCTIVYFIFLLAVFIVCFSISSCSISLITFLAPGAIERIPLASSMLKILIFFTVFMSQSAILGARLQSIGHYYIGPWSQFFLNIALVVQFLLGVLFKLSLTIICYCILFNGLIIFFMHLFFFKKYNFKLHPLTYIKEAFFYVKQFFKKLVPILCGTGLTEINGIIDQRMASYLPTGSQSMFDYVSAFIRIPLQVFGQAFATVSINYFTELTLQGKKKVEKGIEDSSIFMLFLSIPIPILFYFFSYKLLYLLFLSDNFTLDHVILGEKLLIIFSFIVVFSNINRTLLNVFYANHKTFWPTVISIFSTALNTLLNYLLLSKYQLAGIVFATVVAEAFRMVLLYLFIYLDLKISVNYYRIFKVTIKIFLYTVLFALLSYILYQLTFMCLGYFLSDYLLYQTNLYWIIAAMPLSVSVYFYYIKKDILKLEIGFI